MRASSTGLLLMGKLLWSLQSGSHSCPRPALDVAIDTLDAPVAKLRRSEGGGGRCLDALRLGGTCSRRLLPHEYTCPSSVRSSV